jgi:hypothetical protein
MAVLVYQSGVAAQVTVGEAIADPAAASTASRSLPPIPQPRQAGFGRTDRTKSLQANWQAGF